MNSNEQFEQERRSQIAAMGRDTELQKLTQAWMDRANALKYSYHFNALGRPIIQYPQDLVAVQELIWEVKPDLVIETGIAHGGSLVLSASCLALLDYCDAVAAGETLDPKRNKRKVVAVDIDIRQHNRAAIETHPLSHKIEMIEGSSVDAGIVASIRDIASRHKRVMIFLDSNHTHDHVLAELEAYAPMVSPGSYCVVFDTIIENLPHDMFPDRPWSKGDNAMTGMREYLRLLESDGRTALDGGRLTFEIDEQIENKLAITVAPSGFLRRTEV